MLPIATLLSAARQLPAPPDSGLIRKGQAVYANYCAGCHLASGRGNPPAMPPLAGNDALRNFGHVVRTVREGRGVMPAFKRLEPGDVAAVAAYVRNSWGNGFGEVDVAQTTALIGEFEQAAATSAAGPRDWYTDRQATRGKALYLDRCAKCHGADFVPDDFATGLRGAAFDWRWKDRTVSDLFETIRQTMPPGEGGSVGPQTTIDIVAYLLQANGFPASTKELLPEPLALQQLRIRR